ARAPNPKFAHSCGECLQTSGLRHQRPCAASVAVLGFAANPAGARQRPYAGRKSTFGRLLMLIKLASQVAAALVLLFATALSSLPAAAQGTALSGQVTSADEGPMEGVVVSAKKDDSTVTVSVVTNAEGRYSFPAARLEAGQYTISTRAVGYDLEGPKAATLAAGQNATVDLQLRKTRNLSRQLSNAEWMMSAPGTDEDKANLINCVSCHTLERVVKSAYNADEFVPVVARMNGYAQVSTGLRPQRRTDQ